MLLLLLQQKIMPKGFVLSWMQGMEEVTEVQAAICDAGRNDSLGRIAPTYRIALLDESVCRITAPFLSKDYRQLYYCC